MRLNPSGTRQSDPAGRRPHSRCAATPPQRPNPALRHNLPMAQDNLGTIAVVGAAGAIGNAVVAELNRRHAPSRVIGRDRAKLERAFQGRAEIAAADIADPAQAAAALSGIGAVVYCVGLPYPQHHLHPVLARSAVEAAASAGVKRFALVSSVYGYGAPQTATVAETHPREPHTRKGKFRRDQEDVVLAAHTTGRLNALIIRLPDFYGPNAELSLADQVFQGALKNKPATWIGPVDLPHEFVFVPDTGPVILDLLERNGSYGEAWNFAGPGTITGREFIAAVYREAGLAPKFRSVGPLMLRVGGLFSPLLRELVELHYLATTPVILDDTKLRRHLPAVPKTPYPEGIQKTLHWYQHRP